MTTAQGIRGAFKYAQATVTPESEMSRRRLDLCLQCIDLDRTQERCKICTCFVRKKVKLTDEHCPIGKW